MDTLKYVHLPEKVEIHISHDLRVSLRQEFLKNVPTFVFMRSGNFYLSAVFNLALEIGPHQKGLKSGIFPLSAEK